MDGLYSKTLIYFALACVCVLPGILAAVFGRGGYMVAAALFSALALLSIAPFGYFTYAWSLSTISASYWRGLMVPLALAGFCACIAIIQKHRRRHR